MTSSRDMKRQSITELVGGANSLVRQGIKLGGKKGGRAVQQGQSAAIKAGQGAKVKASQGNKSKMVGSGKYEKAGAMVGGVAGGIAGGVLDGPLPVGDIVGGIAGSKLGGKIGRQFDKRANTKKEQFSDWRSEYLDEFVGTTVAGTAGAATAKPKDRLRKSIGSGAGYAVGAKGGEMAGKSIGGAVGQAAGVAAGKSATFGIGIPGAGMVGKQVGKVVGKVAGGVAGGVTGSVVGNKLAGETKKNKPTNEQYTFEDFMEAKALDPSLVGAASIRQTGAGGRKYPERKKSEGERTRVKAVGGGKTAPAASYKDRKDIGDTKARSNVEQQPTKERGSSEVKQSYADKVKAERKKAAQARIAARKGGGEATTEKPKARDTEKKATELLKKKTTKAVAPGYKPQKASGMTRAERDKRRGEGERMLKGIMKDQETSKYKKETGTNPDAKGRTKILGRVNKRMST